MPHLKHIQFLLSAVLALVSSFPIQEEDGVLKDENIAESPFSEESVDNDVGDDDILMIPDDAEDFYLEDELDDLLFGLPDNETGERLDSWTPESGVNPEEMGNYLEGDLLFPSGRNGIKAESARWPRGTIPYIISSSFTSSERQTILKAFSAYKRATCVRFIPRKNERDYLKITRARSGCWSSVGRTGGAQEVNLQSPGCLSKTGTVMHELMHAVGFLHEQNRWERDSHVAVKWDNIQKGRQENFKKFSRSAVDNLGVGYDYKSIMHYSSHAFSKNGKATIVAKEKGASIGQRDGLSKKDIQKIRKMYKCNGRISML